MIYKDYKGKKLSALGFGSMRLPIVDGIDANIDEKSATQMVDYAMANGINYYDTAWGYHAGNSEIVMGKALKKYPRESFFLASKFPGYDLNNMDKVEEIFEKQLQKCQVEYFDFYLIHNLCELNINQYLDPKYHIYDYLMEQKRNGRIKHLGFSVHSSLETMQRFLDAYGEDMEFCQVQLNYLDWGFQEARLKVDLLNKWNIPIWVMEPLRGGSILKLDDDKKSRLDAFRPNQSMLKWCFDFIESIPNVKVVLSGMSNMEQLKENIELFDNIEPVTPKEFDTLVEIASELTKKGTVPCTSCHYCTSHCPKELDIPTLLGLYNEHSYSNGGFLAPMAINALDDDKKPSACISCRSCEAVCPQQIKISEVMKDFVKKL